MTADALTTGHIISSRANSPPADSNKTHVIVIIQCGI
jgi:hypothetical protein